MKLLYIPGHGVLTIVRKISASLPVCPVALLLKVPIASFWLDSFQFSFEGHAFSLWFQTLQPPPPQ